MNELALFAGGGGGILGGLLLGWRTRCAVEIDAYARRVLLARQRDGVLYPFPIWDDITTFDGRPWRGHIDIITGGFPCQDISAAGKGAGIDGARSGLWREMARVICEVGPRFVLVENSPMLVSRGLGRVLGDLAQMGFNARWGVLGAIDAGAPHRRERIWIVADAGCGRHGEQESKVQPGRHTTKLCGEALADADSQRLQTQRPEQQATKPCERGEAVSNADRPGLEIGQGQPGDDGQEQPTAERTDWWEPEPALGRVANGVAHRVDRLRAIGNGQVPAVVRLAWETLSEME